MKAGILSISFFLCTVLFGETSPPAGYAGLLINEFVTNTPDDWVELTLRSSRRESVDISALYVTMYYGDSAILPLAGKPVTIYSYDRPETPYDDRFVVIHLSNSSGVDETDDAGDLNGNNIRDIYCNNYSASLWNTSGIVAIDDDRNHKNGMIDCVVYSNMAENFNSNVKNYASSAVLNGQWIVELDDIQSGCVDIGTNGLTAYMSVSRRGGDSNTKDDFYVTRFQTPGAENIESSPVNEQSIFKVIDSKVFCKMTAETQRISVRLFIAGPCNIRLRVFTATGRLLYESPLYKEVMPGYFLVNWEGGSLRKNLPAGLYPGLVEGTSRDFRGSVSRRVFFVIGR